MPPLEERVEYPYQNIRSKAYPWGDGDKVSQAEFGRSLLLTANPCWVRCRLFCKSAFHCSVAKVGMVKGKIAPRIGVWEDSGGKAGDLEKAMDIDKC